MTAKTKTDPQLIQEVLTRGVENIYPNPEALGKVLRSGKRLRLYNGIDPTGPTLHLGHLVVLQKLRQFQDLGHEVILLIGDFTGMIGDPTDKLATRKPLTHKQLLVNCKNYKKQASKILNFGGVNPVKLMFNSKWQAKLEFEEILNLAAEFTVPQLLERDMFVERLRQGKTVHLHEFLYPMMQGYDSVAMNVDLEVGGNDQTFNMLAGRQMMANRGKEKFVLTMKLLEDPTGKKMGKTEGNMVTLKDKPEQMFGKIMSWPDGLILPGLEILTSLPLVEMEKVKKYLNTGGNPMEAKMLLGREVVAIFYGQKAGLEAKENFIKIFRAKKAPAEMPKVVLPRGGTRINVVDLFIKAKLVASKSEARRLIEQGGLSVDEVVIKSPEFEVAVGSGSVLKRGKRGFAQVVFR
jgi:tyrosyl-tRNA synthetase